MLHLDIVAVLSPLMVNQDATEDDVAVLLPDENSRCCERCCCCFAALEDLLLHKYTSCYSLLLGFGAFEIWCLAWLFSADIAYVGNKKANLKKSLETNFCFPVRGNQVMFDLDRVV